MKKKLLALILVGTMSMAMVACGDNADDAADVTTEDTTEGTTEDTTEDTTEGTTEDTAEDTAEDTVEDTADDASLDTTIGMLDAMYAVADINEEIKEQIANGAFEQGEIDATMAPNFLGQAEVEFVSCAVSMPMMSSVAYQVVVLEVEEGQDVEAVKTELVEKADVLKWVCVEPEAVVAESNGNFVLFVMADTETADALVAAFVGL